MIILLKEIVGNQANSSTFSVWTSEIGLFIDVYKGNITFAFGQYGVPRSRNKKSNPPVVIVSRTFQKYFI